jgi:FMN phosphatase YigB (HAD superfamily)
MNFALDLGQVLVRFDFAKFIGPMAKALSHYPISYDTLGLKEESEKELYAYMKTIQGPSYLGYDTMEGLFKFGYYSKPMQKENIKQELNKCWQDTVTPVKPILDYIYKLHKKGHRISILSNIGLDHKELLLKQVPELKEYHLHLSCDVGAMKPQKVYYQSFLMDRPDRFSLSYIPTKPFFFFDDRQENIDGAVNTDYNLFIGHKFDLSNYPTDEEAGIAFISKIEQIIEKNKYKFVDV